MTTASALVVPVVADAFAQSLLRARATLIETPFDTEVEALLACLPVLMISQLRRSFRQAARDPTFASPTDWAPASLTMILTALIAAVREVAAAGCPVDTIEQFTRAEYLDALETPFHAGRWNGQTMARILRAVRLTNRIVHGTCSEQVANRASNFGLMARRDKWDRVTPRSELIHGAYGLASVARLVRAAGRLGGESLARDAALLAAAAEMTVRLGELVCLNVGMVRRYESGGRNCLEIDIPREKAKSRRSRIACIFEPRTVELLGPLLQGSPNQPLFRTADGDRLSYSSVALIIARTSTLVVGKMASANLMRRAGASEMPTSRDSVNQLASMAANRHYRRAEFDVGHALITGTVEKMRGQ